MYAGRCTRTYVVIYAHTHLDKYIHRVCRTVWAYIYIYIYMCVCVCIYAHTHIHRYIHHVCRMVCLLFFCVKKRFYVCIYPYTHIHTYIHTYTYTVIHTYTHMCVQNGVHNVLLCRCRPYEKSSFRMVGFRAKTA